IRRAGFAVEVKDVSVSVKDESTQKIINQDTILDTA
nr:hypothetical protein [Tanacetum cinerariifolium]